MIRIFSPRLFNELRQKSRARECDKIKLNKVNFNNMMESLRAMCAVEFITDFHLLDEREPRASENKSAIKAKETYVESILY